jgi:hypothetical protein
LRLQATFGLHPEARKALAQLSVIPNAE